MTHAAIGARPYLRSVSSSTGLSARDTIPHMRGYAGSGCRDFATAENSSRFEETAMLLFPGRISLPPITP